MSRLPATPAPHAPPPAAFPSPRTLDVPAPAMPPAPDALPPADLPVVIADGVRVLDRGRLIVGGAPVRLVRLTRAGAEVVGAWTCGAPVGESHARRALARRLLDNDVLRPRPAAVASAASLTVVIPVRDRAAELARCLDGVRATCPDSPVVVVDDGSACDEAVGATCAEHGATLIRHAHGRGAAAARNTGLAACSTPYVAFVDSDVVLPPRWAHRLLAHFDDPCVGAVAPRVRAVLPSRGRIGRYEERHSPLDMGPRAAAVGPGRPTPYVPSAVLLVRRSAVSAGFERGLAIGEDVDLVWRLVRAGWRVRYAPETYVRHDHRVRLRAFVSRRRVYARSVAILSRRHAGALPAARTSAATTAPWLLGLSGHPAAAACGAAVDVLLLRRKLGKLAPRPLPLAGALVARGLVDSGFGLARAVRRAWLPPLAALALRRAAPRRVLLTAFAAAILEDAVTTRDWRAALDDAPVRLLDELVALAGTWEGCARERTVRPLLPSWRASGR